ncbi:MAG TPA: ASCH domain-containing protein [Rubrivivax sp.]|nr:ASCH domain-containing protein [Rubrivivax sp.]
MALSIRQPWAWLVANGIKPVENRTWPTRHRGPTLIHAGLVFEPQAAAQILRVFPELRDRLPQQYELGGIVGIVNVVNCVKRHESRWFTGPYGFVCMHARPLPFRRWPGALGFFRVPDDEAGVILRTVPAPQPGQKGLFE